MSKDVNFFDLPQEKKRHTSNQNDNEPHTNNNKIIVICIIFLIIGIVVLMFSLFSAKSKSIEDISSMVTQAQSEETLVASEISSLAPEPTLPPVIIPRDEWFMKIANKNNPIAEDFDVKTEKLGTRSYYLDERIITEYNELMDAAVEADISIRIDSGYRSVRTQTRLFEEEVTENLKTMEQGPAEAAAEKTAGRPYQSEHQLGLAADLVPTEKTPKDEDFDKTDESKWLTENAWKYGFILRYPKNKEDITGVVYKPWHYRYVGKDQAAILNENGMCLEEYLAN